MNFLDVFLVVFDHAHVRTLEALTETAGYDGVALSDAQFFSPRRHRVTMASKKRKNPADSAQGRVTPVPHQLPPALTPCQQLRVLSVLWQPVAGWRILLQPKVTPRRLLLTA